MMAGLGEPSLRSGRDRIARAALMIAVVTVAARALGFVRVLVFARTVGPSCLGDTYYAANSIPNIVFDVVAGGALSSLVIPVLAGPVAAGDREAANRTASALLTWSATVLVPVTVLGLLVAHPLMHLLVGGGHPGCAARSQVAVGARMLEIFLPQVVLYGVGIVLTGVVQAHRRFLAPAVGPLTSSLVVIGAYGLFAGVASSRETTLSTLSRSHELILSVGTTLGVVALVLPLLFPLHRCGVRLRPRWTFPPGVGATVGRMALSGAVVLGSQQLATGVALRLANARGSDGAVVLFNLAWTVFLLPWAVVAVPLATSGFPRLTAAWQQGELTRYRELAARTGRVLATLCAASAAVLAGAAVPLARVVVLGAPGAAAPAVLSRALFCFAPGVVGFGLTAALARLLYAQQDSRTPAFAALAGWCVAVVLDLVMVHVVGRGWTVAALGVGTSAGVTVTAAWLLVAVRRRAGAASLAGIPRALAAALSGGLVGAGLGGVVGAHTAGQAVAMNVAAAVLAGAVALGAWAVAVAAFDRATLRETLDRIPGRRA